MSGSTGQPSTEYILLGEDLGTTNDIEVVKSSLPAILNLKAMALVQADAACSVFLQDTILDSKKFLGTSVRQVVKEARSPCELSGNSFVSTDGRSVKPQEIAAKFLQHVVASCPQNNDVAVITVPTYFDNFKKQTPLDACTIAGLNVETRLSNKILKREHPQPRPYHVFSFGRRRYVNLIAVGLLILYFTIFLSLIWLSATRS